MDKCATNCVCAQSWRALNLTRKRYVQLRANLYTLSVETKPKSALFSQWGGGGRSPVTHNHYLYQCSISANGECPVEQNVKLLNERKEKSRRLPKRVLMKARPHFSSRRSRRVAYCDRKRASILIPSLPLCTREAILIKM